MLPKIDMKALAVAALVLVLAFGWLQWATAWRACRDSRGVFVRTTFWFQCLPGGPASLPKIPGERADKAGI